MKYIKNRYSLKILIVVLTLIIVIAALSVHTDGEDKIEASKNNTYTQTTTVIESSTAKTTESTTIKTTRTQTATKSMTSQTATTTTKPRICYTEEDLYVLSHVIYGEAGNCSDEAQLGVASVVLNRVRSSMFPNTIKGVVFDHGQYACTWDGNYYKEPDERAVYNARLILERGSVLPHNVVFQAGFSQGSGTYMQIDGIYFCYC